MNAGALALRRTGLSISALHSRLRLRVECSRASVAFWRAGTSTPERYDVRRAMRLEFGIDLDAWEITEAARLLSH